MLISRKINRGGGETQRGQQPHPKKSKREDAKEAKKTTKATRAG